MVGELGLSGNRHADDRLTGCPGHGSVITRAHLFCGSSRELARQKGWCLPAQLRLSAREATDLVVRRRAQCCVSIPSTLAKSGLALFPSVLPLPSRAWESNITL